jgi:Flp pilus assembly protein protease CpaA
MMLWVVIGVAILGVLSSYYDVKEKKIPNMVLGVVSILSLLLFIVAGGGFFDQVVNGAALLVFGFLLYLLKFWAPGDAKLLAAYSLMVPIQTYQNLYIPIVPSILLFTNTLIIGSALIFFYHIPNNIRQFSTIFTKKSLIDLASIILVLFSFSWVFQLLFFETFGAFFYSYLLAYLCYYLLARVLRKHRQVFLVAIIAANTLRCLLTPFTISLTDLLHILTLAIIFKMVGTLFLSSLKGTEKKVKKSDLREHMVVFLEDQKPTYITKDNLQLIKNRTKEKVTIKSSLPLAPIMFIAVLVTILVKGDVITFIWGMLQ